MSPELNVEKNSLSNESSAVLDKIIIPEIESLIEIKDFQTIRDYCEMTHPANVAEFIISLGEDSLWKFIGAIDRQVAQSIFRFVKVKDLSRFLVNRPKEFIVEIIKILPSEMRIELMNTFEKALQKQLFPIFAEVDRKELIMMMDYDENTAGSLMTTDYVSVPDHYTVKETLKYIRRNAMNKKTVYAIYVCDNSAKLIGIVSLRTLIVTTTRGYIKDIMDTDLISIRGIEGANQAAYLIQKYDLLALPVIDSNKRLVGVVTIDDVMDFLKEDVTEDFYKMAAAGKQMDYHQTSILSMVNERIRWLFVLIAVGFLSIYIMNLNQEVFQKKIALAFFIPLLIGAGGNAGSQTSTIVIRGIATGEFGFKSMLSLIRKEMLIGSVMGVILGALLAAGAYFMTSDSDGALKIGQVVASSALILVILAQVMGAALPLGCHKIGIDAALLSTPLITGLIDIIGIVIYVAIAQFIFNI